MRAVGPDEAAVPLPDLDFDLSGVSATIANTLRRLLISEVPTMAIDTVYIMENDSVIQDEILSHRLGLVPILADARRFAFSMLPEEGSHTEPPPETDAALQAHLKSMDTSSSILMQLAVTCERDGASKPITVHSSSITYAGPDVEPELRPRVVHDKIVLARLNPGQSIVAALVCRKGVGKVHAKWSPVGTAAYRLLPEPVLRRPIVGEAAEALRKKCPMGVFDIEEGAAIVARPRECSLCRECIRDGGAEEVELRRVKTHFLFKVESVGQMPPQVLVREALRLVRERAERYLAMLGRAA